MKARVVVVCLVASTVLAGCGNLFDTAAAVVAGRKITTEEVAAGLEAFKDTQEYERLAQQGNIDAIERQVQQSYLSELIRREILDLHAAGLGVEVTDGEVTEQIDAIKEDLGADFAEQLKESGLDEERLALRIRYSLLQDKIKEEVTRDTQPPEAEVEAFYEENLADYVTEMRAQQILVKDLTLAKRIAKQLRSAPEKKVESLFATLARRHSTDKESARRGGDLGVTRAGELDERFEERAAELDIDEVSAPFRTQSGYHVIRVTAREVTPLEQVRDAISQQLGEGQAEERWQEWLREAYEEAGIKINSRYGELDVETQTVIDATAEEIPGAVQPPSPTPSL